MTTQDDRITDALTKDDQAFLGQLEEDRGLFEMIGDSMSGNLGGWAKLVFAVAIVLGFALLYSVYRAVTADGLEPMVGWGLLSIGLIVMQGFVKEWMFARMNMLTVLREVKRLQVQVALLSEQRDD